jgi:hypothetical protein
LRRCAVYIALVFVIACVVVAQSATARIEGEQLHLVASRVHFLTGEALQRLRDGATVNYEFQLTARPERSGKLLGRAANRFAVSYDLWEEKFAITKLGASPKAVSHLTASAAEVWCIDNTLMPVGVLPQNEAFWIRLDYRAENAGTLADQTDSSSFSLSSLVDIFSRRARGEQLHGSEEVGPLRLNDLKRK